MVKKTRTGVLGGEVSNVGIDWRVVCRVVSALSLKDTVRRWPGDE